MDNDLLFETIKQLREELALLDQTIRQVVAALGGEARRGRPPMAGAAARREADDSPARVRTRRRRRDKPGSSDNDE